MIGQMPVRDPVDMKMLRVHRRRLVPKRAVGRSAWALEKKRAHVTFNLEASLARLPRRQFSMQQTMSESVRLSERSPVSAWPIRGDRGFSKSPGSARNPRACRD